VLSWLQAPPDVDHFTIASPASFRGSHASQVEIKLKAKRGQPVVVSEAAFNLCCLSGLRLPLVTVNAVSKIV
jgi:hypothetical protein